MKSISIPFNESQAFELTNSHRRKFLVWCEPAKTRLEIYLSLNNRKELLQTMALIPSGEPENRVWITGLMRKPFLLVPKARWNPFSSLRLKNKGRKNT